MWVKQETYIAVTGENAALRTNVESLQKLNSFYEKELLYWRELLGQERNRGDRAVDSLVEQAGGGPVSGIGLEGVAKALKSRAELEEKQQKQAQEMFGEELGENDAPTPEGDIALSDELLELVTGQR